MKQLGTVIEAYQIIFWLSDNLIRFFEHVNWLLYLIALDYLSFNLSCLNWDFSKLFLLNWFNLNCVQRFVLVFFNDRFDLINLNLYWFLSFWFYFWLNNNFFFMLLIKWLHFFTSIDDWIMNVIMLLLSLSNWPQETDWSFIHSLIYFIQGWTATGAIGGLNICAFCWQKKLWFGFWVMLWSWICGGIIGLFGFWFELFELWLSCWAD